MSDDTAPSNTLPRHAQKSLCYLLNVLGERYDFKNGETAAYWHIHSVLLQHLEPKTFHYTDPLDEDLGVLFTVEEFKEHVEDGMLIDYDGFGHLVRDNLTSKEYIFPSQVDIIPADATHIVWFNK